MTIQRWMVLVVITALVCFGVVQTLAQRRLREQQALIARVEALMARDRAMQLFYLRELERARTELERTTLEVSQTKERVSPESASRP
jgi:hypothetical protein